MYNTFPVGLYICAPLPCCAFATHSEMMYISTNDIIINAKMTAPECVTVRFLLDNQPVDSLPDISAG